MLVSSAQGGIILAFLVHY